MKFHRNYCDDEVEIEIGDLIKFNRLPGWDRRFLGKIFIVTKIERVYKSMSDTDFWQLELVCNQEKAYLYPEEDDFEIVARIDAPTP